MGSRGTESGKSIRNNGIVDIRIPLRYCLDLHLRPSEEHLSLYAAWHGGVETAVIAPSTHEPPSPRPWAPGPGVFPSPVRAMRLVATLNILTGA